MKLLIGGRGSGKTYNLITAMRNNPKMVMICFCAQSADICQRVYPDLAERIIPPIRERLQGYDPETRFVVDNAEHLLQHLLGVSICAATMTTTVLKLGSNKTLKSL